ncbi:MAG TPA: phosphoglucomutase, alpha-D-glucose phosphate-specific [Candidatus Avelusimicrobium excrementipullorum]|nr:phosphoglucomutase, alpha-D-glucose phosphate-specific [Candidatus Avelusimicrobium excrementipullorum]
MVSPLAGTLTKERIDTEKLRKLFWEPDGEAAPVKFGTSGHRGALGRGFCAAHARAIAQAVARIHLEDGVTGPVLCGGDTRLMSHDTARLCAEVLAGNGLHVILPDMPLPTPVFSFEIISGRAAASLNGTASHNPPQDMGLKYNPSHGGPAGSELTGRIEKYANEYLQNPSLIKSLPLEQAREKGLVTAADVVTPYVSALGRMVDFEAIKKAGLKAAIHPLGGSSLAFYRAIKEKYGLDNLHIADETIDPTFYFIPIDHDGKIRMDPSSVYPMKPLIELVQSGEYDFAGASDPDADRFGCATKAGGLIPPNHALCVAADYLIRTRRPRKGMLIGRTLGTTALLDRIAAGAGYGIDEVNVGFKYFVNGIVDGKYILAGEESAGMSMSGWTPEKDGILAVCLLLEIASKEGDIAALYDGLTQKYGKPYYTRVDVPTDEAAKNKVKAFKKEDLKDLSTVAGEKVTDVRDTDGIKVYLQSSWFLVRPSGTENILKFYAETFISEEHLQHIIEEGRKYFGV